MQSPIDIAADHPFFTGHFPAFPVVPGAVLLDEALQIIERQRGIDLKHWKVASAKFLDVVRPGDMLRLEHESPRRGLIQFVICVAGQTVVSGTLSSEPSADSRA